jgi:hypothetical protein
MSERRDPYLPVLFVTYDRLAYTVHSLNSLLASDSNGSIKITIWDNNSTDGTRTYLKYLKHKAIDEIILSDENVGLAKPMNYMFRKFGWAVNLMYAYDILNRNEKNLDPRRRANYEFKMGAISGWAFRPWGEQTDEWYSGMPEVSLEGISLKLNSYICGTGVIINMNMIRERGLLFEGEECIIGGWTSYCRIAHEDGWKFGFHMDVFLKLLNLDGNHALSNDFPEYDAAMKVVREEGDKWWVKISGTQGIRKLVEAAGGYEKLG